MKREHTLSAKVVYKKTAKAYINRLFLELQLSCLKEQVASDSRVASLWNFITSYTAGN